MTEKYHKFIKLLKEKKFEEASDYVEDFAKKLAEKEVPTSPLDRLSEILSKTKKSGKIDKIFYKSEIMGMRIGLTEENELSNTIANLITKCNEQELNELDILVKALINFYKIYSVGDVK